MRAATLVVGVLAGVLVPVSAATPPPTVPGGPITTGSSPAVTAKALPSVAGARPVRLTVGIGTTLQCGRPRPGPVIVSLPRASVVPAHIAPASVRVNGGAPASVAVAGHVVSVAVKPVAGLTCDVVAPGRITVVFTRAARIGNPARPGRYAVAVRAGDSAGRATLVVS